MKHILKTISAILLTLFACPRFYCDDAVEIDVNKYNFNDLLDAIAIVESNNNPDAVGDDGNAIGAYQIHKIYVDDCNRILRHPYFSYKDRLNIGKSRTMVDVYLRHYGRGKTIEQMARIHNGGPAGHKKESTKVYWLKVKRELEK